jgi:hypothetical protein
MSDDMQKSPVLFEVVVSGLWVLVPGKASPYALYALAPAAAMQTSMAVPHVPVLGYDVRFEDPKQPQKLRRNVYLGGRELTFDVEGAQVPTAAYTPLDMKLVGSLTDVQNVKVLDRYLTKHPVTEIAEVGARVKFDQLGQVAPHNSGHLWTYGTRHVKMAPAAAWACALPSNVSKVVVKLDGQPITVLSPYGRPVKTMRVAVYNLPLDEVPPRHLPKKFLPKNDHPPHWHFFQSFLGLAEDKRYQPALDADTIDPDGDFDGYEELVTLVTKGVHPLTCMIAQAEQQ